MREAEAIVRQLEQTSTATYAIAGTRIYWNTLPKNPTFPLVRVSKISFQPLIQGLSFARNPGIAGVQVIALAKTQEEAADLADAITADLAAYCDEWTDLPLTSPPTSGALAAKIEPTGEQELLDDDMVEYGLAGEARTFSVHTR
jgi:hypothetical protein